MKYLSVIFILIPLMCFSQGKALIGYSFGSLSNSEGLRYGISAGVSYTFNLTENTSIEPIVLYSQKGSDLIGIMYGHNAVSTQLNCIDIPVYFNVKCYKSAILGAGFGPCIAIQSRNKYKSDKSYIYTDISNVSGLDFPIYIKFTQDISKKLFIQPSLSWGLLNQFNSNYTRTLTVYIGVRL